MKTQHTKTLGNIASIVHGRKIIAVNVNIEKKKKICFSKINKIDKTLSSLMQENSINYQYQELGKSLNSLDIKQIIMKCC